MALSYELSSEEAMRIAAAQAPTMLSPGLVRDIFRVVAENPPFVARGDLQRLADIRCTADVRAIKHAVRGLIKAHHIAATPSGRYLALVEDGSWR